MFPELVLCVHQQFKLSLSICDDNIVVSLLSTNRPGRFDPAKAFMSSTKLINRIFISNTNYMNHNCLFILPYFMWQCERQMQTKEYFKISPVYDHELRRAFCNSESSEVMNHH